MEAVAAGDTAPEATAETDAADVIGLDLALARVTAEPATADPGLAPMTVTAAGRDLGPVIAAGPGPGPAGVATAETDLRAAIAARWPRLRLVDEM